MPRIFEKAYAKIHGEVEKKPTVKRLFVGRRLGRSACATSSKAVRVPPTIAAQYLIADRLVFKRIREAFGGRVRMMITGAAPTAPEILSFFWSAGLPVYEAYGMTESTVITHINREGAVRLGTVGRVIPPTVCRIAEDGEILVKGPWVFRGYYKQEEATAETIKDEWLHTGDIGEIDADGYLRITDRKKHLIITAGGKNIAPANIERAIKGEDPLISQVHAHGDRRNFVSALIAPSPIETLEWGLERGLVSKEELMARQKELLANPAGRSEALNRAMGSVVKHPELRERIRKAVGRGNTHRARRAGASLRDPRSRLQPGGGRAHPHAQAQAQGGRAEVRGDPRSDLRRQRLCDGASLAHRHEKCRCAPQGRPRDSRRHRSRVS